MEKNAPTLKAAIENGVDMDIINLTAKVVFKEEEVEVVGSMKLKKSHCYIADESCSMKLILWQSHIEKVSLGDVYTFRNLRVRECNEEKGWVLNTTVDTLIEENGAAKLANVIVQNFAKEATAKLAVMKVDSVHSIAELSRFKQCCYCSRKIKQDSCNFTVKCYQCSHIMRSKSCKVAVVVKFLVEKKLACGGHDEFLNFVMFQDNLEKICGPIDNISDDEVLERLLRLENFEMSYNAENVVKDVIIQ